MARWKMDKNFDAIYLAPHLDDAILSCGGQISTLVRAGRKVLIVTLMAGDDSSPTPESAKEQIWRVPAEQRRMEDIEACQSIGADYHHEDFLDCIYRRHPKTGELLYRLEVEIFGEISPADAELVNQIAERLATLPTGNKVFAPLGVGNHVDHQIVRLAAEKCYGPLNISYYEDFPYCLNRWALRRRLKPRKSWKPEIIPLTEDDIIAKCTAIGAYKSQMVLFKDFDDMEYQVRRRALFLGGERLWLQSDK